LFILFSPRKGLFHPTSTQNRGKRRTLAISRRADNLETFQVSRMKATLFAVGCMALLGAARTHTSYIAGNIMKRTLPPRPLQAIVGLRHGTEGFFIFVNRKKPSPL